MSVIWTKVWYDIWNNKIRTLLAVASIAVGVFAVGTIFGMSDLLLNGMDHAHQAVVPSHIQMYLTTPIDRDTVTALKSVPGVEGVEPFTSVTVRYKVRPDDKWQLGVVLMRDDYRRMKYDLLQLKEGPWPSGEDIGIERLSSQYFKIGIGDHVIFELPNKTERSLPIVSKVRHPFVPPPQFGGQAFFFVDAAGMERFGVPQGKFESFYVRVTPYSKDYAKEVATRIKDRLAKEGIDVGATLYQDPNKHWGRVFVEGITLVMEVLAIVSLFMSVVLVFNTTVALITQQTNQIGVIKAIGGTTRTVMEVYLAGVLILGVLALVISLPTGVFLAYAITRWFLNLFNIDYPVLRWSGPALLFQVLAAVVVPLLAALWPVLKGAIMTVREAIATYGLGGDFGGSRLDRFVERIGRRLLPPAYAMALANTFRRKGRLALSLLVLVTAGTMFLMVMSLSASITATLDAEFQRRTYNINLVFLQPQRIDQATELAESQPGVTNATMWFSQPATILFQGKKTNQAGLGTEIDGVPLDNPMYTPPVVAGRWLEPTDDRAAVISRDTATDNHIGVGDTITLDLGEGGKSDWQVVGLYKVIFGGIFRSDAIYAPRPAAIVAAKKNPRSNSMYLSSTARNQTEAKAVSDRLEEMFRQHNLKVSVAQNVYADRQSAESQFSITIVMLLALAVIVAVVGGVGLTGSLAISVIERTKEVGVMRAIGARSPTIGNMFVLEGVLQGLLSWVIAVPLSYAISRPMASALGNTLFSTSLAFRYNTQAVAVWLVIVLVISTLASAIPARSATRISVRQSLAYE